MKRFLLFTMMLAVVSMFTACEDTDAQLAEKLKGTWIGTTLINEEEHTMMYQFFESTDGKTGKFVEITRDKYSEEVEGTEYELPCSVYVGGTYKIDEGWLSLTYAPKTAIIEMDDEELGAFADAYLHSEKVQNDPDWAESTVEDIMDLYDQYIAEEEEGNWTDMYENLNANKNDGYSNLTIKDGKMSYKTGDAGVISFDSTDDIFKQYPFDE